MFHHESMDNLMDKCFERWTQSDALASRLAEKVRKHLNLTERYMATINHTAAEEILNEKKTKAVKPKYKRNHLR